MPERTTYICGGIPTKADLEKLADFRDRLKRHVEAHGGEEITDDGLDTRDALAIAEAALIAPTRAAEGVREACPAKDFMIERVFGKDCEFTVRPDLPCDPRLFGEWLANVLGRALAAGPSQAHVDRLSCGCVYSYCKTHDPRTPAVAPANAAAGPSPTEDT